MEKYGRVLGHLIHWQKVDADKGDPQWQPAKDVEHDDRQNEMGRALVPFSKNLVLTFTGVTFRVAATWECVDERNRKKYFDQGGQNKGKDDGEPDVSLAWWTMPHQITVVDVTVWHCKGWGMVENRTDWEDAEEPSETADDASTARMLVTQVRQIGFQYGKVRVHDEHEEEERTGEPVYSPFRK